MGILYVIVYWLVDARGRIYYYIKVFEFQNSGTRMALMAVLRVTFIEILSS